MRVDQVVAMFEHGDAISDEARLIRNRLRVRGVASTIYAPAVAPLVANEAELLESDSLAGADVVIYHHAVGSELGHRVAGLPVRTAMIYHNVTPPGFFRPYSPAFADLLEQGRSELGSIASRFSMLFADSAFNAAELGASCGRPVEVLPFPVDFDRFDVAPDPLVLRRAPNETRILAVGRIAPNKGLMRLVAAFAAYRSWDAGATLTLVGRYVASDPYHLGLRREVRRLGLDGHVRFTGGVDSAALLAWYQTADLYVTLSEHEGFCVPLVEAMHFDVPIVAAATSAIPETLGPAGVVVGDAAGPDEIAALLELIRTDAGLRGEVLAAQRSRRADFGPVAAAAAVDAVLDRLTG